MDPKIEMEGRTRPGLGPVMVVVVEEKGKWSTLKLNRVGGWVDDYKNGNVSRNCIVVFIFSIINQFLDILSSACLSAYMYVIWLY